MSLDHATNGKETRAWQFDKFAGSKISFLDIDNFISNYRILGNHLLTMFSNLIKKQKLTYLIEKLKVMVQVIKDFLNLLKTVQK